MSEVLWMNIPLMAVFFGLWVGIPLWFVLRDPSWRGKPGARTVPAYLTAHRAVRPARRRPVSVPRAIRVDGTLTAR